MNLTGEHNPEFDEDQVIRLVLSGKRNEFRQLVSTYQGLIYAMIKRQIREEETARELTQEVFLRAYKNLKQFRFQSKFSTWLTRIAINQTNSYFRSKRFRQAQKTVSLSLEQFEDIPGKNSEGKFPKAAVDRLTFLVASLKPKYRDVVVLCCFEGRTYDETAEILQIPVGTVCSRMNKSVHLLRELFKTDQA